MKKFFALLVLALGCSIAMKAQIIPEAQVPKAVLDQYHKDFPNTPAQHWEVNNWKPKKQYVAQLAWNGISTRARYIEDGTKVWNIMTYTANQVPAATSGATLSAYPGFKVDWATEVKNFQNNTDVFDLRLSKTGYVLHAYVNADGTIFSDKSKMPAEFNADKN